MDDLVNARARDFEARHPGAGAARRDWERALETFAAGGFSDEDPLGARWGEAIRRHPDNAAWRLKLGARGRPIDSSKVDDPLLGRPAGGADAASVLADMQKQNETRQERHRRLEREIMGSLDPHATSEEILKAAKRLLAELEKDSAEGEGKDSEGNTTNLVDGPRDGRDVASSAYEAAKARVSRENVEAFESAYTREKRGSVVMRQRAIYAPKQPPVFEHFEARTPDGRFAGAWQVWGPTHQELLR